MTCEECEREPWNLWKKSLVRLSRRHQPPGRSFELFENKIFEGNCLGKNVEVTSDARTGFNAWLPEHRRSGTLPLPRLDAAHATRWRVETMSASGRLARRTGDFADEVQTNEMSFGATILVVRVVLEWLVRRKGTGVTSTSLEWTFN